MSNREIIGNSIFDKAILADPITGEGYKAGGTVDAGGSQQVNTLGRPTAARKIVTTPTSASVTLTTGVLRISMLAALLPETVVTTDYDEDGNQQQIVAITAGQNATIFALAEAAGLTVSKNEIDELLAVAMASKEPYEQAMDRLDLQFCAEGVLE